MDLIARIPLLLLDASVMHDLLTREALRRHHDRRSGALLVPIESQEFEEAVQIGNSGSGLRITPYVRAQQVDLAKSMALRLRPSKTVREGRNDFSRNQAILAATEPEKSTSGYVTRRLKEVVLSKIRLGPHEFAGIDEWTNSFVVGRALVASISRSRLTGWSFGPAWQFPSGFEHESAKLLVSTETMPEAELCCGAVRRVDEVSGGVTVRWNGPIVYSSLGPLECMDFACTAEPENSHGMPAWLMSHRAYRWYQEVKARGLRFEPVVLSGTEAFERQRSVWTRFQSILAANPKSRIW